MDRFIEYLNAGKLVTAKCPSCNHLVWPPADLCPRCLNEKMEWVELDCTGRLLEFSESFLRGQPVIFGLVELNQGIRLMARIICPDKNYLKKDLVKLVKCGVNNGEPYFEFQPI